MNTLNSVNIFIIKSLNESGLEGLHKKKTLIIIPTLLSDLYTFDFTLSKISLLNVLSNATVFIMDRITKVTSKIFTEGGVNNLKSKKKPLLRNKAKIANCEIRLLE